MDIDRVRYFHIFAQSGSLVKASELLNISQPALSKALKLLQQEVSTQLLEPEGRGLRLTPAGVHFKNITVSLLNQWQSVAQQMTTLKQNSKIIRFGSFEVFTTFFIEPLMSVLDTEGLEVHSYGPGKLEEAIAKNQIDLGLTYVPIPKAGVEFTEVTQIKMGVFGLSKFITTSFKELNFITPLYPPEGTPSKAIGLDGWPDHLIDRNIKFRVAMMSTAIQLAKSGHGVAYLPVPIVSLHNKDVVAEKKLVEISSTVPQKDRWQSVYLVSPKGAPESAMARRLAKYLRSLS
jgi:DNA-binding transcriptional LysR family regulator